MSYNNVNVDTYPDSGAASGVSTPSSVIGNAANNESIESSKSLDNPKPGIKDTSRRAGPIFIDTTVQPDAIVPPTDGAERTEVLQEKPVTWLSLPRKDQLLILTLARLSEPLTQTSLGSYVYYQLQSFNPELPDSTVSFQAGMIHAAFPAAQFLTAMLWGRYADSAGRKRVIWIGLLGTMFSMIGFGFSHSFEMAIIFRCLGGMLNGNIGVMRTMISEIVKEKKYQSRAFLILPMTFNVGVIIGPVLGGILADPVGSYPSIFGPGSLLGGKDGVKWMMKWPYALPNLLSAVFLFVATLTIVLFLEETSELAKHKYDPGLRIGRWIRRHIFRERSAAGYEAIPSSSQDEWASPTSLELPRTPVTPVHNDRTSMKRNKLPFKRIWTRTVVMTLLCHSIMACHVGTFNSMWFIYLSAPRYDPSDPQPPGFVPHGFLHFTGGLALPPARIGAALAILGAIGITLQIFLYPPLSLRLGPAKSLRFFLTLFPISYLLVPFLSIIPSSVKPPDGVSGALVWIAITVVLFVQVLARTFALPSMTILVNNCCPHPSVLGTVHGLGQSFSSFSRTFGPIFFGWLFGKGLDIGIVGLAWWTLACVAVAGSFLGQFVKDGDGHEILLDGEFRDENGVVRRTG
ncbi:MFS general substrate transporter [Periconia macrospinosa]|uniref:MFS general substrate transporter n=1 Tax=Periconia macrospinosa TaxID=97972 RepID=A0A2V1DY39_9PLEO|nr:MFS general substrate transporter [Periconia macrospinosa]